MSPQRVTFHMQIKRNPNSGALQQWINGALVYEWGSSKDPMPGKEETRRLLQSALEGYTKGRYRLHPTHPKED